MFKMLYPACDVIICILNLLLYLKNEERYEKSVKYVSLSFYEFFNIKQT